MAPWRTLASIRDYRIYTADELAALWKIGCKTVLQLIKRGMDKAIAGFCFQFVTCLDMILTRMLTRPLNPRVGSRKTRTEPQCKSHK